MRWTWVWVIVLVFGVLGKGTAQTVKMTDSVQTLRMVFDEVEQQTGMLTLFSNNELDMYREVKLESREYTLKELYEYLLKGTGLEFEILNHYVVIRPVRRKNEDGKMLEIKGKVSDERGEPLPGVSIVVKGSSRGVITDANGEYRILLPKVKSVILLFSFIGKRMKQVMYLGKGDLNIVMEDENQEVEEVVITGFQNVSKRHLDECRDFDEGERDHVAGSDDDRPDAGRTGAGNDFHAEFRADRSCPEIAYPGKFHDIGNAGAFVGD